VTKLQQELIERLERLAADEGTELLAVDVVGIARSPTVRLVLDRPEGGVTLADCERVSRQASVLLDAYDPFPGRYNLEVTSPGLDRKLYRPEDYLRFAGRQVLVRMRPTWKGGKQVRGALGAVADGYVALLDHTGEVAQLPETEIFEIRLAPFSEEAPTGRRGKR
jgi:ribosome maturation factor RimP